MYAPKFISWMSDEERFHSALEVRIAPLLESARAECKAMVYLAEVSLGLRPPLGLPPPSAQIKYNAIADQAETLLQMLYNGVELSTYYNEYQKQYANGWSFK